MIRDAIRVPLSFHEILDEWETSADHYFLTGKAGTGKSTLLQLFRNTSKKRIAVLAPTGMAAIQVRGQTIHSFLKLPPRLLTRDQIERPKNSRLLQKLDTIVIDEISMVRADLLDAIDVSLQLARKDPRPFGGVQMIFFGDIFQLPPVVSTQEEKAWFSSFYEGPYFFNAHCLERTEIHMVTLTEVFRQSDPSFIAILDAIRHGDIGEYELEALNARVGHSFGNTELAITLCSMNVQADAINRKRMMALPGEDRIFTAEVNGVFSAKQYPAELVLTLKKDAQVMFVKNDLQQRYVNGTLGKVTGFSKNGVLVLPDGAKQEESLEVEAETWEIIHYRMESGDTPRITHEIVGTFQQLPLRPAWAITIHKSQGQTFDRVSIDLGRGAFEFGQTYVALSRCKSLQGISLSRPLRSEDIMTDPKVTEFFESKRWL